MDTGVTRKTTTDRFIKSLHKMVHTFGLPIQIITDNSPKLSSTEFKDFMN